MQEEIKNGINAENREKRKLNDAELAQVTGGVVIRDCDHKCSACNVSKCPQRAQRGLAREDLL